MPADLLFDVPAVPPLPDLRGSQAQLDWANQVRPKKLKHARDELRRMELLLAQKEQRRQAAGGGLQSALDIEHLRARIQRARAALAELEREKSAAELLGL